MISGTRIDSRCYYAALLAWSYMFSRFDTIPECDTQTHDDGIYRANIASRGINEFHEYQSASQIDYNQFFTLAHNHCSLRGHGIKLIKERAWLDDTRKFYFSQRVVNGWNCLPHSSGNSWGCKDCQRIQERLWPPLCYMLKIWTPKAKELASPLTYKYKCKSGKYLGVHLSSKLSWNDHVDITAKKASQASRPWILPGESFLPVQVTSVSSVMNLWDAGDWWDLSLSTQASSVWDNSVKRNINNIEAVQSCAARFTCRDY